MQYGTAKLIQTNEGALNVVASGARISTGEGNAFEIFEKSGNREKDLKLVGKVLSSGHKSVIEHQTFSIAFNDVSVLVEQFVIEFRLASFTVKSRRYVNFSDAGFVVPKGLSAEAENIYMQRTKDLFAAYDKLLELSIPKEDARFVLPYGFRSNFFVTLNARELMLMVSAMLCGRGKVFDELVDLGRQLKEQFDAIYPGLMDVEMVHRQDEAPQQQPSDFVYGTAKSAVISLLSKPADSMRVLDDAIAFNERFNSGDPERIKKLINDARPRELELLNYSFKIDNVSLACVTHFTRHRMLSLMLGHELSALSSGNYILPTSIVKNEEALCIYKAAFEEQTDAVRKANASSTDKMALSYFAMAGHVTPILISMNARELLHFSMLRSCSRAQWEIRAIARRMIELLCETDAKELFKQYGPTCAVMGKCPEGKMSCGHPVKFDNGKWVER